MRRTNWITILFLAVTTAAFAGNSKTSTSGTHATKTHTLAASGTLETMDASSHVLALKVGNQTQQFTLAPDVKIHHGHESLMASDLASHVGSPVRVEYMTKDGINTAAGVWLTDKHPAHHSTSK